MIFVGLDWASTAHAVCVLDSTGTVRWRGSVPHSADGLAELVRRLRQVGSPETVQVAIERPSGVVIDTLMDAGVQVVPIHPNVVKASRSRYSAAHAKSDEGDSYLLADLLRTDGHRFRRCGRLPMKPGPCAPWSGAAMTSRPAGGAGQSAPGPARALLAGAAVIFADVDSPIALAFLARYPTPQSAERVGESRLPSSSAAMPTAARPAAELLGRLRGAPVGRAGEAECEASGELVRSLVAVLVPLVAQIQQLSAAIAAALADHPDGPLIQSLPRSGQVNAAQLLAELGDDRARFPTAEQLTAEAGAAPSPARPGSTGPWSSAGRATNASAEPSRRSPITRGMPRRGPPPSTPAPERAVAIIPTPSGSSRGPGCASSGGAGRIASPTTSHAIGRRLFPPPDVGRVDTGCLIVSAPLQFSAMLVDRRWSSKEYAH